MEVRIINCCVKLCYIHHMVLGTKEHLVLYHVLLNYHQILWHLITNYIWKNGNYKNVVKLWRTKRRLRRTSENIRGPDGKSVGARRKFKFLTGIPTETYSVENFDGNSHENPLESVDPCWYFRRIREAQITRRPHLAFKFWGGVCR